MSTSYIGRRDVKKEHYNLGILLTEEKKIEILKETFLQRVGYELNLENPRSFNEKIMWMKLYYQNPLITRCCDKYAVKDYVTELVGEEYIVPTIKQWSRPEDINFDELPDQFVLKVNWSSGYNIICKDKSELDRDQVVQTLKGWMKPERNSYYQYFNWGFKHMKPVVYAEEYLEQVDGQVYDYKFFTFDGKVKLMFVATDRSYGDRLTFDYFDRDYNHMPFTYGGTRHANPLPPKPKNWEKMIALAEKLAKPFPFCRVDFYEIGDEIRLGEMTFYSGGGLLDFDPVEWDYEIGSWIHLPEKTIIDKEGALYPARVKAAKVGRKLKSAVRRFRRKIIRHDRLNKKNFVTLFGGIRFRFERHVESEHRYVTLSGVQFRGRKATSTLQKKKSNVPLPEFDVLPPRLAYMMEDQLTLDMKKHYCEQKAYAQMKYFPNLDNPKSWNEKLLWLALYYKNPHHAVASDKAKAKDWIAERVGEEYTLPLLGVYDNVNDIDFEALPSKFVMKANEGWGGNAVIIVTDKKSYDIDRLKANASNWLYPWASYYYNNMCITDEKPEKHLIVIEKFLEHEGSKYLDDYKFYCCNGDVKFAMVITERGSKDQRRSIVDADWNVLPVRRAGQYADEAPKKPKNLEKMFELARTLSKDFPLVRIDFYNIDGRIYVGEMTFTPGLFLRFEPKEWDFKLGEYLDLTPAMEEMNLL